MYLHIVYPSDLKCLGIAIKKMRNKLKNDYFSNLANNINIVGEARKIEEVFRLCKSYTMHKHTDTKLITSEKLTEFFQDHLKEKPVELQTGSDKSVALPSYYTT